MKDDTFEGRDSVVTRSGGGQIQTHIQCTSSSRMNYAARPLTQMTKALEAAT